MQAAKAGKSVPDRECEVSSTCTHMIPNVLYLMMASIPGTLEVHLFQATRAYRCRPKPHPHMYCVCATLCVPYKTYHACRVSQADCGTITKSSPSCSSSFMKPSPPGSSRMLLSMAGGGGAEDDPVSGAEVYCFHSRHHLMRKEDGPAVGDDTKGQKKKNQCRVDANHHADWQRSTRAIALSRMSL